MGLRVAVCEKAQKELWQHPALLGSVGEIELVKELFSAILEISLTLCERRL